MARDPHPFAGIDRLLIDGNNLLHRVAGGAGPGPLRGLLPRLRAAIPRSVETIVMLDGPPDPGTTPRHLATPGIEFRHSGRIDADRALLRIVTALPSHGRLGTVVVTDDRSLTERVRAAGAVPRRLEWLQRVLATAGSAAGAAPGATGAPPPADARPTTSRTAHGPDRRVRRPVDDATAADAGSGDEDEAPPWRPGRGATRKRGNPHRHRRG
jgi:hypothetical protein